MPGIITRFSFKYLIPVSIRPTEMESAKWSQNTKDNVNKLIANLQAIVPDTTAYGDNLVTPAVQKWANFVNPAFVSKKGETAADITNKMAAGMASAASKYLNNVKEVLDNGGALYKAAVDAKQANWANPLGGAASYLFPVTGSHGTGLTVIPFTLFALTGQSKAMRMLGDTPIKGNIINIVKPGLESSFRAAMNGLLIQMYKKFYRQPQTADVINAKIALLANTYINPAVCNAFVYPAVPASSALYYARGGGNNQLCCQIVSGTP